jgi:hypothetical protein
MFSLSCFLARSAREITYPLSPSPELTVGSSSETCMGVAVDMVRTMLSTSPLQNKHWDVTSSDPAYDVV